MLMFRTDRAMRVYINELRSRLRSAMDGAAAAAAALSLRWRRRRRYREEEPALSTAEASESWL